MCKLHTLHTRRNTDIMSRSRSWIGTWNDYPENWKELIQQNTTTHIAQLEKGKKDGKLHIQFFIRFANARTLAAAKKPFGNPHLEIPKNPAACMNYCKKADTFSGERIDNTKQPRCKDPLEGKELRPLQRDIINIVDSDPDDRHIHWVYDPIGNMGKTTLAKHLCLYQDNVIYICGKASDMKYAVLTFLKKHKLKP